MDLILFKNIEKCLLECKRRSDADFTINYNEIAKECNIDAIIFEIALFRKFFTLISGIKFTCQVKIIEPILIKNLMQDYELLLHFKCISAPKLVSKTMDEKMQEAIDRMPTVYLDTKDIISINNCVCNHCKKDYVKIHHTQKYCGEKCRTAYWKLRTDKTFNKPKTK